MFQVTDVFTENYNAKEKIVINQGGTSSSKTYSLMQLLSLKAIIEKGCVISVVGESIPNLKKGAYRDMQSILSETKELKKYIHFWNQSDRIILFKNGSIIEFNSYETEQSAKNGKRDYLFCNEANGISYRVFWQLAIRTRKQIYLDYNPTAPFWAHELLIGTSPEGNDLHATVKLIISDHRHNTFLSEEQHRQIEGIKDKDLWQVYARGKTGNLSGIIYTNCTMIKDSDFPNSDFWGGLDFGYTNDPTAGVKLAKVADNIYIHELCYTPGLAPIQIKQVFYSANFKANTPIYCDHDPNQIIQLRKHGLLALQSIKGAGSINSGIIKVKEYKLFYTESSINFHNERQKYMWKTDKLTGKSINTPEDNFNHLMDAMRYGIYTHLFRK